MPRSVSTLDHSIPCQKTSAIEKIMLYRGVHPVDNRGAEWGARVTFVSRTSSVESIEVFRGNDLKAVMLRI